MNSIVLKQVIKSILSSSVGNIIEWYEYTLYAYFATVISKLFFPSNNLYISMIMTFTTFAVGLAARPIGGVIFGYIGDKFSRKQMLILTMLLMSIPTLCIGMLPTYNQIGIAAPIILVILRIMQGIALGGEFGASCTYLFESVSPGKRGFFGGLALTGVGMGLVLSSFTIFLVEAFATDEDILNYAWRIPFFISVLGAILGFYMRKNLLETNDFIFMRENSQIVNNPFFEMLRNHKKTIFKLFTMFITTQISFFIVFIFGKSMMIKFLGYSSRQAGIFNMITVISYTIATLIFGYLSDRVNKILIVLLGASGIFLAAYPFMLILQHNYSTTVIISCSILMGQLIGMTEGTLNPLTAESFPANIRATSVAFCWNFTSVTFGGIAPIISMWLIDYTGNVMIVAFYLMTACTITIFNTVRLLLKKKSAVSSII